MADAVSTASQPSPADLLVLHALRVTGFADDDVLAERSGIEADAVRELLGDHEAHGWVTRQEFAGTSGWSLTERGRVEDTRRLTNELTAAGAREAVAHAHQVFEPLNARVVRACTDWQLRPQGGDRLAANDHTDPAWDARVLDELGGLGSELRRLACDLAAALPRFGGYHGRFTAALARARTGQVQWVAGVGVASCHAVWMELHEDLLSTLGIPRGAGSIRRE